MKTHKTQDGVDIEVGMEVWFRPSYKPSIDSLVTYFLEKRIVDSIEDDLILIYSENFKNITTSSSPENIFARKEDMLKDRKKTVKDIIQKAKDNLKTMIKEGQKEIERSEELERQLYKQ